MLVAKYGLGIINNPNLGMLSSWKHTSLWWRDLVELERLEPQSENWIASEAERKVGNGRNTAFWNCKWIGDYILSLRFTRLLSISSNQGVSVADG